MLEKFLHKTMQRTGLQLVTNMKTPEKEYKANAIHGRLFLSICILGPPFTTLPL